MRICRIVNVLPNAKTPGEGLVPYYLAKYIIEPTLYITRELNGYRPLPPHVKIVTLIQETTTPPKLRQAIFGTHRLKLISRAWLQGFLVIRIIYRESRFFPKIIREMAEFRPDLVVCGSLKRLVYGVVAKYLFGCKLILSLHNTTETAALKNLGLLRVLIRAADRVVVVSSEIARRVRHFVPDNRVRLSSTGVDLEECSNWNGPRRDQLVTIGSFKWKKGYRYLLEAAALVFKEYPTYRLLIVGDGEERRDIVNTIQHLGLEENVVLTGVLSRTDVVRVLNESKLFVMASLHEGLPKALLEAIACGTPAVVTDGCNAEGIIDETGMSVPVGSPEALANAVIRVLQDKPLWKKCSYNGPQVAQYYDWRAVASRDYAMYRELFQQ